MIVLTLIVFASNSYVLFHKQAEVFLIFIIIWLFKNLYSDWLTSGR